MTPKLGEHYLLINHEQHTRKYMHTKRNVDGDDAAVVLAVAAGCGPISDPNPKPAQSRRETE